MSDRETYNLIEEYKDQIQPLVQELQKRCMELGIPMLAAFKVSQDEEGEQVALSVLNGEPVKDRGSKKIVAASNFFQSAGRPPAGLGGLLAVASLTDLFDELGEALAKDCQCPKCKAKRGEIPGSDDEIN